MALQKQPIPINFAQGLETKTDPNQVPVGKFLALTNSVFTKGGALTKRNGFGQLPASTSPSSLLSTLNGNLVAIGSTVEAFAAGSKTWVTASPSKIQPLTFTALPTNRSSVNITACDTAVSMSGLACTAYTEVNNTSPSYKYSICDSITGQTVIAPTLVPGGSGTVAGSSRVFVLGNYFIVVFTNTISAVNHLQYIAIPLNNPTKPTTAADIAASYAPATTVAWDGVVYSNQLYIAYNTTSGGQQIQITSLTNTLIVNATTNFTGEVATMMGMSVDSTIPASPIVYLSYYDSSSQVGKVAAVDATLAKRMSPTSLITSTAVNNITCAAQNGVVTSIYEVANNYGGPIGSVATNFLKTVSVVLPITVTTGTVGTTTTVARSVGLASKAFIQNSTVYVLTTYSSTLQPTYFLMDTAGNIISRFAYENSGGYLTTGLPQAEVIGSTVWIAYLFKDLIDTITAPLGTQGSSTNTNVYSQTGSNLASFTFSAQTMSISELGQNLNISGGMLMAYDGQGLTEQGFHLFPDSVIATWSASGGSIHAQPDSATNTNAYYYQCLYEWSDAAGNIQRSAPSIPVGVTTTSNGTSGSIAVTLPTLRLSYKAKIKLIIYRWSVAQEVYHQVTSITAPTLNDPTVDYITYTDTLADASISGNSILYTTGGVIENIAGPTSTATSLFDDRLWVIDAEDRNLLWYSKQVIESTPLEMSDLFTIYVAPSLGAQGSTGPIQCLAPMDDKLIIFKKNAIYYINGTGPDNTGANSQYSQPIFISSAVGCSNQNSIVITPQGLMFQSDKGIWLLGRGLDTQYIGAPVEAFNSAAVNSALVIPGTTQVRFTLSTGIALMFDYYYQQWGTFSGIPAVSSTLYNGLQTYINGSGQVYQETPGVYLDGSNPVLMSFTTSWINLAGLQGFERFYFFFLLGTYFTPFKLNCLLSYDYLASPTQSVVVTPDNFTPNWGDDAQWGSNPGWGGSTGNVLEARVFPQQQKCQSFQLTIQEIYDPSLGVSAGQGFSLSGLSVVAGMKRAFRTQRAARSFG